MTDLETLYAALSDALTRAQMLNAPASEDRSRELSLAITKIEEARHWLDRALHGTESGPERSARYGEIAREAAGLDD